MAWQTFHRSDIWRTYQVTPFSHALTEDRRSQNGVILHQVRRRYGSWWYRAVQSNFGHTSATAATKIDPETGEARFQSAIQQQEQKDALSQDKG